MQVKGEDLIARAKAIAAKLGKAGIGAPGGSTPPNLPERPAAASSVTLPDRDEISRRVEEAKRLKDNAATQVAMSSNPYLVRGIVHDLMLRYF